LQASQSDARHRGAIQQEGDAMLSKQEVEELRELVSGPSLAPFLVLLDDRNKLRKMLEKCLPALNGAVSMTWGTFEWRDLSNLRDSVKEMLDSTQ
jgi:hypothetical protein